MFDTELLETSDSQRLLTNFRSHIEELKAAYPPKSEKYNLSRLIELNPDAMANDRELIKPVPEPLRVHQERRKTNFEQQSSLLAQSSYLSESYLKKLLAQDAVVHVVNSHFDSLTHLPNRAFFESRLQERMQHSKTPFSVMFLDLDGFKQVNDTLSHRAGDELLKMVAARLQAALRDEDFLSRLAGDEFCILLEASKLEDIQVVAQRVIREVSHAYWIMGQSVQISASIGIARFPEDGEFAKDLMHFSDQALYHAKRLGKKQYVLFADYLQQAKTAVAVSAAKTTTLSELSLGMHSLLWGQPVDGGTVSHRRFQLLDASGNTVDLNDLSITSQAEHAQLIDWLSASVAHYVSLPVISTAKLHYSLKTDALMLQALCGGLCHSLQGDFTLSLVVDLPEWRKLLAQEQQQILSSVAQSEVIQLCVRGHEPWQLDFVEIAQFDGFLMTSAAWQSLSQMPKAVSQSVLCSLDALCANCSYETE